MKTKFENIRYVNSLNNIHGFDYIMFMRLKSGKLFLMFCIDDAEPYKYVGFEISYRDIEKMLLDEITIYDIYDYAVDYMFFEVTVLDFENDCYDFKEINTLPESYRPDKNIFMNLSSEQHFTIIEQINRSLSDNL